jgi:hypothetical protein
MELPIPKRRFDPLLWFSLSRVVVVPEKKLHGLQVMGLFLATRTSIAYAAYVICLSLEFFFVV